MIMNRNEKDCFVENLEKRHLKGYEEIVENNPDDEEPR